MSTTVPIGITCQVTRSITPEEAYAPFDVPTIPDGWQFNRFASDPSEGERCLDRYGTVFHHTTGRMLSSPRILVVRAIERAPSVQAISYTVSESALIDALVASQASRMEAPVVTFSSCIALLQRLGVKVGTPPKHAYCDPGAYDACGLPAGQRCTRPGCYLPRRHLVHGD